MGLSATHILLLLLVVVLLFGRGKISELMGDVARGIKSFKKGMADDDTSDQRPEPRTIEQKAERTEVSGKDRNKAGS